MVNWLIISSSESVVLSCIFVVVAELMGVESFCVVDVMVSPVLGVPVPLVDVISSAVVVCGSGDVDGSAVVSLS